MTVRVLIVDDSPTMRGIISAILRRDPEIEVVGTAAASAEARTMIRELNPDVITLDIEMPGMDGLALLEKIMRLRPTPVVMVSGLTHSGAQATLTALEIGAVDFFAKPKGGLATMLESDDCELRTKVKAAAACRARLQRADAAPARARGFAWNGRMIALAASTGGVEALGTVLATFPENCPPTVIVQHMPSGFTRMFAARLNDRVAPMVAEAEHGMILEQGRVYIAPGGPRHLTVAGRARPVCRLVDGPLITGHRPSADMLFRSLLAIPATPFVAAVLTGMGEDGAAGLTALRHAGSATTIAQDAASSLIFGMPRAAIDRGGAQEVLPLCDIGPRLLETCRC